MIYLANAVERSQDNGVAAAKVFSVSSFRLHRGEEVAVCTGWLSEHFLLYTLLNRRTKTIRDFYTESDGEIRMVVQQYRTDPPCDDDDA